jgi:hypothetical protein
MIPSGSSGTGEADEGSGALEFDGITVLLDGGGLVLFSVELDECEALPGGVVVQLNDANGLQSILGENG